MDFSEHSQLQTYHYMNIILLHIIRNGDGIGYQ